MKCKNCGHEIVKGTINKCYHITHRAENVVYRLSEMLGGDCKGIETTTYAEKKCWCGCDNPEPEVKT